jgi:hypothetical protein
MSKRYHEMQQIFLRVLSHASWEGAIVKNFFGADGLAAIKESVERAKSKRALAMSFQDQDRVEEEEIILSEEAAERRLDQQAVEVAVGKVRVALTAEMARMAQPQASPLAKAEAEQVARERAAREAEARERVMREAETLAKAAREAEAVERAAREAQAEAEKREAMAKEEEEEMERARVAEAEAARLAKAQAEQIAPAYTIHRYGWPRCPNTPWTEYPFKLKCEGHSWSFRVVSKATCPPFYAFFRRACEDEQNETCV